MKNHIPIIINLLAKAYPTLPLKELTKGDPFKTLIATILSQRAKDTMTIKIADNLFKRVGEIPENFEKLPLRKLEELIYASGTYRQKAKNIKDTVRIILKKHQGQVPRSLEKLISLPGVGRKTANIVLNNCFHTPAIAVDIHVHRITNRLGWVKTTSPEKTEFTLMKIIPQQYWNVVNHVFVRHGQEVCYARKPKCSTCPIMKFCLYAQKKFASPAKVIR